MKRHALLALLLGAVALPGRLLAQQGAEYRAESFSLASILSAPFPSDLIAAPSGRAIAWIGDEEGRRNVWAAEAPAWRARRLTRWLADDGQELSNLVWSADSRWLFVVRGGDPGGNHNEHDPANPTSDPRGTEQALWVVALHGGAPRRLGPGWAPVASPTGDRVIWSRRDTLWTAPFARPGAAQILFKARGSSNEPAFSPDGRTLAFVSDRGDHSFIGLYDFAGHTIKWISPGTFVDRFPKWSPDGSHLAFIRQPGEAYARGGRLPPLDSAHTTSTPYAIRVADVRTLDSREIWRAPNTEDGGLPGPAEEFELFWPVADRLVFASELTGWLGMYSISMDGGDPTRITPTGCEVYNVTLARDHQSILYDSNCGDIDRHHIQRVHILGGSPREITSGPGIEWQPQELADTVVALLRSDAQHPASLALADADSLRGIGGWALPDSFPAAQLVTPTQVVVRAADSTEIHCQLFLPPNLPAGQRVPALMFFHGGPSREMLLGWHFKHYYSNAYAFNQYMASRGFVVLSVNYRGGVGYGRAFRQAAHRGRLGASEYQDLMAAATWLRARPDVDTMHVGLWGGSYGGYLTALGLARNSDLFAAGFDLHGVHDYAEESESTHRFGVSDSAIAAMRRASAIGDVEHWKSPVLLVQGDDDRNVQFQQSVDLALRLRREGVRVEELVFPDEIHDFLRHASWLAAYKAGAGFLAEVLRR